MQSSDRELGPGSSATPARPRRLEMLGPTTGLRADTISPAFDRFAGASAVLAGAVGFLYSVSFVIVAPREPGLGGLLSALCLLLGGILSTVVLSALYVRFRAVEPGFALWAEAIGLAGALGSTVHGGYDLANAIHPPATTSLDLPNPVDPRGLLTFGAAGLAVLVFAWLIHRGGEWPKALAYVGYGLAALFVIVYLGRLIVLSVSSPVILVPAALAGFVVNPAWYVWLGLALLRGGGR